MSFSVYLPKKIQPETKTNAFRHAVTNAGEFIMRIGRKVIKAGAIALFRNAEGNLCRIKVEGATTDGNYVYGTNGMFLAVREFRKTWRLQTPLM